MGRNARLDRPRLSARSPAGRTARPLAGPVSGLVLAALASCARPGPGREPAAESSAWVESPAASPGAASGIPESGSLVFVAPAPAEDQPAGEVVWDFLREKYDADGNGRIRPREYPRGAEAFRRLDVDGDGVLTPADFAPEWDHVPRTRDFRYGEGGPEPGDPAPDFRLPSIDGGELALADLRADGPLALVFGSFT